MLFRIDDDHANPRRAWQDMGEPDYPSPHQVEAMHAASALRPQAHLLCVVEDQIEFDLIMPPQSVAALKIDLAS
jgi:xylan 1,4-beta-xylosidase